MARYIVGVLKPPARHRLAWSRCVALALLPAVLASPRALAQPSPAAAARAPATPAATVSLTVRRPGSPEPASALTAGSPFQLVLRVEALERFPAPGEELQVIFPLYLRFRGASAPQGAFPDRPGYTRLVRDPGGITLSFMHPEVGLPPSMGNAPSRFRLLFARPLRRGEALEVVYGHGDAGAALAQELAVSPAVPGYKPFVCQRVSASGLPMEVLATARPAVLPSVAARLEVLAPSTVRPAEPFALRVAARDRFGNQATGFNGVVEFKCPGPLTPPPAVRLAQEGQALEVAAGAVARAPGVFRIQASSAGPPALEGRSNPVLARTSGPAVFFGDLHVHSGEVSADAYGSMQGVFEWARDVAGLDFVAKSDHSDEVSPQQWARTRELVARFDEPGRFAAFLGFEWTPARSWGHRSVVFPGDEGELSPAANPPSDTPERLWAALARHGGLAVPHLPSAEPLNHHRYDWSRHDAATEPVVEIYSQWGPERDRLTARDAETNPQGVQRALTLGYHLGFVAGSDNHAGLAGRTGGLAGVLADRLDRASIFRAVQARRTFGTTGQRILVGLRTPDAAAGSVSSSTSGAVNLHVWAHGTGPLERLELVRGFKGAPLPLPVVAAFPAEGREDVEFAWQDPAPLREAFYYLRVHQQDGARAWSSPVWLNRPAEAAASTAWTTLPAPAGWEAGTAFVPSPDTVSLHACESGFELRTALGPSAVTPGQAATRYFWARSAPFELAQGRHRLRYRLTSRLPAYTGCLTIDSAQVNAGYAELLGTPAAEATCRSDREFVIRPHSGPVRLLFYFMPASNRYRLEGFALKAAGSR